MKITDAAIGHRVSVFVLIGVLAVVGLGSYMSLPREAAPEIEIPMILVSTIYLGVSPEDIESLVTRPIEQELQDIKDIEELRSTSAESASIIVIQFTTDVDLDEATQEVREKVDLARPKLPFDAEDPVVKAINTTDFPMMLVNVTGPYSVVKLRKVAEDIQDDIKNIQGVLDVRLAGGVEREIQVRVDPARLNHYGIGLGDVTRAISGENINMPGGDIKAGDASFTVRVPGEFKTVDEIAGIVVKIRGDFPVFLHDLAEVRDTFKERDTISRLDGKNNVSLNVTKRAGENMLIMSDEIKAMLAELQPRLPAGTEIVILGDQSKDVLMMVKELENNIITGLLLVMFVIIGIMGFRNSVLVGLAIPLSMLITFFVLTMFDITLNMIVLFSLILALGMLVDNAIVIVENIYRHAGMGKTRVQAAKDGVREVGWPVTTSTLTTVAAFFPLLFWPGMNGEFMGYLPLTLIITLVASLFVALVITPVLCSVFLGSTWVPDPEQASSQAGGSETGLKARLTSMYKRSLGRALDHRWRTVAIGGAVFIGTFVLFGMAGLGVEFFPETSPRKIFMDVNAGDGSRLQLSDRIAQRIEVGLQDSQNILHYVADVGTSGGDPMMGTGGNAVPHLARVSVDFVDLEDRTQPVEQTVEGIRNYVKTIPGARIEVNKERMGPPVGAPVTIEIVGDEFDQLGAIARDIRHEIENVEGLVDLKDDFATGKPELRIEVDRERAVRLNANIGSVASTVRTAINGSKASVLRDGEDEYDIVVRLAEDYRDKLSDIEALRVNAASRTNPNDTFVIPLGAVANISIGAGRGAIRHKELERMVTVTANVEGRLPNQVLEDVQKKLADFPLPPGYGIQFTGEDKEAKKSQAFLSNAFLIALFLIGLILVTQFNSITLPAIIMLAVLLSLVGVLWGQLITQMPFGIIMTGLGVISLAGVVVNNAIVLVDYIQQVRARGVPRREALIEAGMVRLRPVLLTAVTTVLGLMPMALGISIDFSALFGGNFGAVVQIGGRSSEFWVGMAVAVIFGLIIATVLTLVVVPVLYEIFDDIDQAIRRRLGDEEPSSGAGSPEGAVAGPERG